jgi:hypothetical protein
MKEDKIGTHGRDEKLQILGKTEGKKPFWKRKHIFENNIKRDLKSGVMIRTELNWLTIGASGVLS